MRELTAATPGRRRRIDAALRRSPVQPYFRARASSRLAVLAYHGIDDTGSFAAQLERLRRLANPIGFEEVAAWLVLGKPLPPHSVLVTFDDGDHSVVERGLPLMAEHRIPGLAFVIAELVGTDRPFWWSEAQALVKEGGAARLVTTSSPSAAIRALKRMPDPDRRRSLEELRVSARRPAPRQRQLSVEDLHRLAEGGIEIGNHSLGHPCLNQCDDATVRTEIVEAHRLLTGWLGTPPRAFAYPNGFVIKHAEELLDQLDYTAAFLFDHRLAPPRPKHRLRISRLRVNSTTSRDRFDTILSGLHPAVHRLRGGV
ncbi:polysaccharide deacetylase family protein [Wenjunlia tyrosinilytica]|uniref:NodB homology domain-containing protein n=1 Tax=Wenjunlia tyrosinilytica TaxID=1544741 RepID=A0A917ZUP1_9ACTN|nr:polysaccharide deacetylase family protein [Wenjunlia tyrosinilytica]GGO96141.1 hypothetical protein GCM10012280_54960 [Wenjunlia tyrosinilytica]